MPNTLAVIAPQIGVRSETFIRRHMQDLYPGRTVVVAGNADKPGAGHWTVPGQTLVLSERTRGVLPRLQRVARKRLGLPSTGEAMAAKSFLKSAGVSVLLCEYLDVSLSYLPLAKQLGVPFYAHAHGYDVSMLLRDPAWVRRYADLAGAAGIITVSQGSREKLIELGLDGSRIAVIPCCVPVPDAPVVRPETGVVRCVAVGRMVGKKAPILTLDAFRRAVQEVPSLHLDYIGGGELLPAARQFVRAFGLESQVTLHGAQPSEFVQARMASADIFVQHSIVDPDTGDEEGLPVAVLEAMGLALPVVSTRHAGIPEAVAEGETGYLVDEGDSTAMGHFLAALASDPDLRGRMGRAGWARAKAHFTWERERTDLLRFMGLAESAL